MAGGGKGGGGQPQNQSGFSGKGGGGMPQNQAMGGQYMNTAAGQAGTQPAIDPQQMQQRQQQMQQMMQQRQQMMGQYKNFMNMNNPAGMPGAVPPPPIDGGINSLYGQTGPQGAAPLDLGDPGITGTGANPAVPPTPAAANFAASVAPGGMAPPGWYGGGGMGRGMGGRFGGFGGSRANMMGMFGGRGQMANGGIVTLASGGQVWEPQSKGGVTYAPAMANPAPAPVPAAPVSAAPPAAAAAAPNVSWKPGFTPGAGGSGGSMFSGINMNAITKPAAYVPKTQQAIWQPPAAAADTSGKGWKGDTMFYNLFGIPLPKGALSEMSDRQYTDYRMQQQKMGSGSPFRAQSRGGSK